VFEAESEAKAKLAVTDANNKGSKDYKRVTQANEKR